MPVPSVALRVGFRVGDRCVGVRVCVTLPDFVLLKVMLRVSVCVPGVRDSVGDGSVSVTERDTVRVCVLVSEPDRVATVCVSDGGMVWVRVLCESVGVRVHLRVRVAVRVRVCVCVRVREFVHHDRVSVSVNVRDAPVTLRVSVCVPTVGVGVPDTVCDPDPEWVGLWVGDSDGERVSVTECDLDSSRFDRVADGVRDGVPVWLGEWVSGGVHVSVLVVPVSVSVPPPPSVRVGVRVRVGVAVPERPVPDLRVSVWREWVMVSVSDRLSVNVPRDRVPV